MSRDVPKELVPNTGRILYANAVFAGGGVRGIAHIGALKVAESLGYRWQHVAGSSAGALAAALLAAGYTADELYQIFSQMDYKRLFDTPALRFFHLPSAINLLMHGGLRAGTSLEAFIREALQAKKKTTFGDLLVPGQQNNSDPIQRYRLTVIASDLTRGRILRLPHDAHLYGLDPDELEIARAVRMSCSIPLLFIPVSLKHKSGYACRIVDGGMLSNLPLFLFERPGTPPDIPTFGFRLVGSKSSRPQQEQRERRESKSVLSLLIALFNAMMNAHDGLYLDNATYVRTISIPVNGIGVAHVNITPAQIQQLYQNGQEAATKFFSTWDFEAYKATYGSDDSPFSRLEQLHAAMKEQAAQQTMASIVTLPDQLRDVATVLIQQGECTLEGIVNLTRLDETTVISALTELMENGYIRSSQLNGQYHYKVVLLPRRRSRLAMSIDV